MSALPSSSFSSFSFQKISASECDVGRREKREEKGRRGEKERKERWVKGGGEREEVERKRGKKGTAVGSEFGKSNDGV